MVCLDISATVIFHGTHPRTSSLDIMAAIITVLLAASAVTALHVRPALGNPPKYKSSMEPRQSVMGRDPFDHSWITEWAALGDSYASGIGAGNRVSWWCSRYDRAYGQLINDDEPWHKPQPPVPLSRLFRAYNKKHFGGAGKYVVE